MYLLYFNVQKMIDKIFFTSWVFFLLPKKYFCRCFKHRNHT